jgi:hypothetical protein
MIAAGSGVLQEVAGISLKSQSIRGTAVVRENKERSPQCLKMPGGAKRKRPDEADGNMQKGQDKVRLLVNPFRPSWKVLLTVCCSSCLCSTYEDCLGAVLSVT